MEWKKLVVIFCFVAFLVIVVHHWLICGRIFDVGDMLHHEFFAFGFLSFGVGFSFAWFTGRD
ncbi:MAG: hypothetical protein NWF06_10365 [Candidatus Bathyarchaeota archaeon]|nr:hypothetical protein [Candidatus Bathyarchaeum sp.]